MSNSLKYSQCCIPRSKLSSFNSWTNTILKGRKLGFLKIRWTLDLDTPEATGTVVLIDCLLCISKWLKVTLLYAKEWPHASRFRLNSSQQTYQFFNALIAYISLWTVIENSSRSTIFTISSIEYTISYIFRYIFRTNCYILECLKEFREKQGYIFYQTIKMFFYELKVINRISESSLSLFAS